MPAGQSAYRPSDLFAPRPSTIHPSVLSGGLRWPQAKQPLSTLPFRYATFSPILPIVSHVGLKVAPGQSAGRLFGRWPPFDRWPHKHQTRLPLEWKTGLGVCTGAQYCGEYKGRQMLRKAIRQGPMVANWPSRGPTAPHLVQCPGHLVLSSAEIVQSLGFLVQSLGHLVLSSAEIVQCPGFLVQCLGHLVLSSAELVQCLGFLVQCLGHLVLSSAELVQSPGHLVQCPGFLVQSSAHFVLLSAWAGSSRCALYHTI